MPISFQCPNCGKKLKAPDSAVGKSLACPGCETQVTCPEPIYDAEVIGAAGDDAPHAMASRPPGDDVTSREGRRPCPMCGEMILATAAKCRFCGELFDLTLKNAEKSADKKGTLGTIARLQKYLVLSILLLIISYIGLITAGAAMQAAQPAGPNPGGGTIAIFLVLLLVVVVASLGAWALSVLLATKLFGAEGGAIVFFLQFVPCVNLLTLLVVNNKATNLLREKGYTVGFLGADLSEFR